MGYENKNFGSIILLFGRFLSFGQSHCFFFGRAELDWACAKLEERRNAKHTSCLSCCWCSHMDEGNQLFGPIAYFFGTFLPFGQNHCSLSQKQNQTEHVQNVKEEDQEHKIYVFRVVHSNVPLWIRGSHIFANTTSSVVLLRRLLYIHSCTEHIVLVCIQLKVPRNLKKSGLRGQENSVFTKRVYVLS